MTRTSPENDLVSVDLEVIVRSNRVVRQTRDLHVVVRAYHKRRLFDARFGLERRPSDFVASDGLSRILVGSRADEAHRWAFFAIAECLADDYDIARQTLKPVLNLDYSGVLDGHVPVQADSRSSVNKRSWVLVIEVVVEHDWKDPADQTEK